MTDGYGGVSGCIFLDEHIGKGLADDVASSDDYYVSAFDFYAAANEQLNNAVRCAG